MVLTAEEDRFPAERTAITRLWAETYNFAIYGKSDSQICSNGREYLEAMVSLPKNTVME